MNLWSIVYLNTHWVTTQDTQDELMVSESKRKVSNATFVMAPVADEEINEARQLVSGAYYSQ